jgi:hypothetical protein
VAGAACSAYSRLLALAASIVALVSAVRKTGYIGIFINYGSGVKDAPGVQARLNHRIY